MHTSAARFLSIHFLASLAFAAGAFICAPAAIGEEASSEEQIYNERYRPKFHFTAKDNRLNDPNGLVFYKGVFHLSFQVNSKLGGKAWGHAVSSDLMHWTQLENILEPDHLGPAWSGSAVVDWNNTSGLQEGADPPLVASYTAAAGRSDNGGSRRFTQCIAYSNDGGATYKKYHKNPVLPHRVAGNRDPKVIWFEPTKRWIMVLFLENYDFGLFASPNLRQWQHLQTITLSGSDECPDFFPLPLDGDRTKMKWILMGGNGYYSIGDFDGETYTPGPDVYRVDCGNSLYAPQTFSDVGAYDSRRIQIAWLKNGTYPGMPFTHQLSLPCQLTLQSTPCGARIFRRPVREVTYIRSAMGSEHRQDRAIAPDTALSSVLAAELMDVSAVFEVDAATEVGIYVRGEPIAYSVGDETLSCLGATADMPLVNGRIKIRVLVDRASLEVFGNDGEVSLSSCCLPDAAKQKVQVYSRGGKARLVSLDIYKLDSVWPTAHDKEGE